MSDASTSTENAPGGEATAGPDRRLVIAVAGVPYGCQDARPDGLWLTEEHVRQVREAAPGAVLQHLSRSDLETGNVGEPAEVLFVETSGDDPGVDIIEGIISGDHVRSLVTPALRWVQCASVGVEFIRNTIPDGVLVTNARGVHSRALAESIFAGVLHHAKHLDERKRNQATATWVWAQVQAKELTGSVMTIVGTGAIGQQTARRAKAFDMTVYGVSRSGRQVENFDKVVPSSRLHEVLPETEYLVLAIPHTPETAGLVTAEHLRSLPKGAFVANVGRGQVIDEESMISLLDSGHLGGAYLDVYQQEPLPSDSPLWKMPNVLAVPHDSHASQLIGDNDIALFSENLRRYLRGEELVNLVDFERGY